MPPASTVWMVHVRTGLQGVKGVLAVEDGDLVFRPESPTLGRSVFPLGEIARVRRARWTPVLEVETRSEHLPHEVGFYFVKPPSLSEASTESLILSLFHRRTARRRAVVTLRRANAAKRAEIEGWVRTLRELLPED
jgi:hypothetical protein